jgi:hypothetical protein
MPLLVNTAKYTTGLYNSYQLIEEMARLSKKYPKEIGKIYKAIVRNKHFPGYEDIFLTLSLISLSCFFL